MKNDNNATSLTLISHPIFFVDSYDEARRIIDLLPNYKEFFLIGDNVVAYPASKFKERNIKSFRIRPAGSWNSLFKAMGMVEQKRDEGEYAEATDLLFISLISAHDISSALNRHRAVNHITCREMYFLDCLDLPDDCAAVETLHLALRAMPSLPVPIPYSKLTIQQRFDLTAFEFPRFTRPIHCVTSVEKSYAAQPFYTSAEFGPTYQSIQANSKINIGTVGHTAEA